MAIAAPFPAARPASRPRAARRPTIQLTQRGRTVLLASSMAVLFLTVVFSGRITADAGNTVSDQGAATTAVVVQPGESLWQIAKAVAPGSDPRELVARIRDLNGLGDAVVVAGQTVLVPVAG